MQELASGVAAMMVFWVMFLFLWVCTGGVLVFFVCRLLLAVSKWFEIKTRLLSHDLALNNYRDDD